RSDETREPTKVVHCRRPMEQPRKNRWDQYGTAYGFGAALARETAIYIFGTQGSAGSCRGPSHLSGRRLLVHPSFTAGITVKRGKGLRHRFSFSRLETRWHVMGLDGQPAVH